MGKELEMRNGDVVDADDPPECRVCGGVGSENVPECPVCRMFYGWDGGENDGA